MPKVEIVKDDSWRSQPPKATTTADGNIYLLMQGNRLIVLDEKTQEEKYLTTESGCSCPAGEFKKTCKHIKTRRAMVDALQG